MTTKFTNRSKFQFTATVAAFARSTETSKFEVPATLEAGTNVWLYSAGATTVVVFNKNRQFFSVDAELFDQNVKLLN